MAEPKTTAASSPAVRWDASAARIQAANLTAASTIAGRVILAFGERQGEDAPGRELGAVLHRRIALEPMTAKYLHDMLARLIAEMSSGQAGEA